MLLKEMLIGNSACFTTWTSTMVLVTLVQIQEITNVWKEL